MNGPLNISLWKRLSRRDELSKIVGIIRKICRASVECGGYNEKDSMDGFGCWDREKTKRVRVYE